MTGGTIINDETTANVVTDANNNTGSEVKGTADMLKDANLNSDSVLHMKEDKAEFNAYSHDLQNYTAHNLLWDPKKTTTISQDTKLMEFKQLIEQKYQLKLENYSELYDWSIKNYVKFWEEFWHFSKLIHSKSYDQVLDKPDGPMDDLPFKWFDGALLNYAENLLRYDDDQVACYSFGEAYKEVKSITFKDLRNRVRLYQDALRKLGISRDDVVVGYLPNFIETLEAKLAVGSLGAIWSCASPDFGSESVTDRFSQIKPKLIFSVTSVIYNGKKHDHKKKLIEVVKNIESIQNVVLIPFYDDNLEDIDDIPKNIKLDDFLKLADADCELKFEQVPFYHPLVILYSSGTTGTPKCIVHSHGGTLIQHLKEHLLQGNMTREDIIIYYTTTGWMMYNWLITSLAVGATIVLYDGSPLLPTVNVLWDLTDKLGVTMFGTSAKWLATIEQKNCCPKQTHKLDKLKIIYSTGSPLKPTSFEYVYKSIKEDVVVGSITGGSDIISLFCGHNVNLPVYCGQIQCRHLGMAVECWDLDGKHVYDECGELVCVKPFPSMPIYFANDPDFKKYKASYFEKFNGIWTHGDFCMVDGKTGGVTIFGRSDGTLNPNGVRFGSADIYNIIENNSDIEDSLCVGQKNPTNPTEERVILFIKLKPGHEFNDDLVNKIKSQIRNGLSPRHVPNIILHISEIPYTLNGKKVEVPVRRIIEGHDIKPSSSLVNPKCLDLYKNIDSLNQW